MVIVRGFLGAILCMLLSINALAGDNTIGGRVMSSGKGVADVAVSDGFNVVKTNSKGWYTLDLNPLAKFVFISVPSGYDVLTINSVPQFYKPIGSKERKAVDFDLKISNLNEEKYRFIVWADPQVKRPEDLERLKVAANDLLNFKKQDSLPALFAMGCGDIVFDRLNLFGEHNNIVSVTGLPFFQAKGNHDMDYNNRSAELSDNSFGKVYGPSYYSFNKGKVHYVVLDNVFYLGRDFYYIGYLDERQLSWLQKDLSYIAKGSTVVVNQHIPSALDSSDVARFSFDNITKSQTNKKALYDILKDYKAHIVSGHMHNTYNVNIGNGIVERVHSSVCGSWWYGDVAQDGTPYGYGVATVMKDSIYWQFKAVGHDLSYQVKMYPAGANSEQPGYITANVWNWSTDWQVYWYEDGVRMGKMERYSGFDPSTLDSYANAKNRVPKWVKPEKTSHLFRAVPVNINAKISVEAIDCRGVSYWAK